MHQPTLTVLRAACAAALLALTVPVQAQSAVQSMPATAPAAMERQALPAPAASGDNTPAPVARQQAAELSRGDPARWHREDRTSAERMQTLRKETAAALQENLGACRSQPAAERSACVREARATYQQEMASLGRGR